MNVIYVSHDFPLNRRMRKAVKRGKLQVVREDGEHSASGGGLSFATARPLRMGSALVCVMAQDGGIGGGPGEMEERDAGINFVARELGGCGITAIPILPSNPNLMLSARKADGGEVLLWVKTRKKSGEKVMLDREGQRVHFDFLVILANFQSGNPDVHVLTSDEVRGNQHTPADSGARQNSRPKREVLRARDYKDYRVSSAHPDERWGKIIRAVRG